MGVFYFCLKAFQYLTETAHFLSLILEIWICEKRKSGLKRFTMKYITVVFHIMSI